VKCLVFNGWAAGPETWDLCTFPRDRLFDYLEQLDGLPEREMDDTDEAVLVGFSMGGSTALRMLLRYPGKVKGLILVSTTARMMECREEGWPGMSLRRRAALKFGTQLVFRGNPSPLFEERNMDRGLDYLQNTDLRADLRAYAAGACPNLSTTPPLHPGTIPVALFQSERDGIVRPHNVLFLKEIFPQAQVTMVPGGEHGLPVKVPELIDAAVCDVLQRAESGERRGDVL